MIMKVSRSLIYQMGRGNQVLGGVAAMRSARSFATVAQAGAEKDYYTILQVATYATPEEVKAAYRALAKKHHPDVRSSADAGDASHDPDVEKFRDVVEAYQVLSVRESRAAFDISRKKK